jgi:uncharacterized protein YkwD
MLLLDTLVNPKRLVLEEINDRRDENSVHPLHRIELLDKIAWHHVNYMAKKNTITHFGFKHRGRFIKKMLGNSYVGENVCKYPSKVYSQRVVKNITDGWMRSEGHKRNILNPAYTNTGIGCVVKDGSIYIVQIFMG